MLRIGALAGLVLISSGGCSRAPVHATAKQVIVIGVDGMDPGFVERHWSDLPNLARLRQRGGFSRLATTTPPQSPVAWASFLTGLDPEQHGIFDFAERNPSTLQLFSSMSASEAPRFRLPLGPYQIPLSPARVRSLRNGRPFWEMLGDRGIPSMIVRLPVNYPPSDSGEELAGMGTPDLRGTEGTFTFFTDDPDETSRVVAGGVIVRTRLANERATLVIEGPPNSLRHDQKPSRVTISVDVDPAQPFARFACGEELIVLKQGEWSDWVPVDFPLLEHVTTVHGMVRIYAKQLHPRFEIYVSPVNVDPLAPSLPIASPARFSHAVAADIGRYSTLGIPEDTAALRQGAFDLKDFLSSTRLVLSEERRLLDDSLRRYQSGLLVFYFSSVDQNSHILWEQHEPELLAYYRAVDDSIGEVRRRAPSAQLIVMSDHGFTSFTRAVHLNAWLRDHGLLAMRDEKTIDWAHTRAYAMGLNALYLNLAGREKYGIVQPGAEARAVENSLRSELLAFRDPENDRSVVETLTAVNAPEYPGTAPDLIVGYGTGYRASWETALGEAPSVEIEDNVDAWIADHCINAADVPGILLTSEPMRLTDPRLTDLPVTILRLFGVAPGQGMKGRSIF